LGSSVQMRIRPERQARWRCRLTRLLRLAVGDHNALEKSHRAPILHCRTKLPGLRSADPPSRPVLGTIAQEPCCFNRPARVDDQLENSKAALWKTRIGWRRQKLAESNRLGHVWIALRVQMALKRSK